MPDPPNTPAPRHAPLDRARLARLPGWSVEVEDETPSTNLALADRARAGAPTGTVLLTEHQTAGRGRLDRGWTTPRGAALTFSVLLRPAVAPGAWPWLPLLTGLAVVDGLAAWARETGVDLAPGLKWPNDVLVADRKLCGILLERVEAGRAPAAILGVGLNTALSRAELPVATGTSVRLETGTDPDRTALLVAVLDALAARYGAWAASGGEGAGLREDYRRACVTLDRAVRVELPDGSTLAGTAVDVDEGGRLVVAAADGARTAVGAGDVVHVRTTPSGGAAAPG